MATDEHDARPAPRWARFARPAPGEERPAAPAEPPRPLHGAVPPRPLHGAVPPHPSHGPVPSGTTPGPVAPALVGAPPAAPAGRSGDTAPADRAGTWPEGGGHVVGSRVASPDASAGSPFDRWPDDDDWPGPAPRDAGDGGRSLAVASIVFAVFAAPVGLVLGLLAAARARRVGASTRLAAIGIVLACVVIVVSVVWGVAWLDYAVRLASACRRVGPGDYLTGDGSTVTCS